MSVEAVSVAIKTKNHLNALLEKIETKSVTVAVVGLGYVGLPFLVEKAKVGLNVIGIDRSEARVAKLCQGENYIEDVKDEDLKEVVKQGLVTGSSDPAILASADVIVICVPTPLDKNLCPDLQYVQSVSRDIAKYIRPGQLVSLESTTYPGTTDEVIKPLLEESGLIIGREIFLAHSPERVDPGNKRFTTKNTNKIVGAVDKNSLKVALAFYKLAIENVVPVSSAKIAEMVKVYENTFRAVNIALANEVALLCDCMDVNVWEMLDAAFTKPFGIMPFYPGPGVGGHCIPIDPHYLEWKAKEYQFNTRFITLAGEVNRRMPLFVINKVTRILNDHEKSVKGAKILMLGVSYKHDISDYRESPALEIFAYLQESGADVCYHDDHVPEISYRNIDAKNQKLTDELLKVSDLVLIAGWHTYMDYHRVVDLAQVVLDTRNATKGIDSKKVVLL